MKLTKLQADLIEELIEEVIRKDRVIPSMVAEVQFNIDDIKYRLTMEE